MRSVLQLRTPEDRGAAPDPDAGLTAEPTVRFRDPQIEMAHGAGGKASRRLVDGLLAPLLYRQSDPVEGDRLADAARVLVGGAPIAITTDSFVVTPLAFPGGSIGELAVNGTVNDLAVGGARPVALVTTLVLEAGLPTATLVAELRAMRQAARDAGVAIVGGDTKVVEHGKVDRLYISTTGIGHPLPGVTLGARSVRPGDRVLLSGPIGDHGITILLARGELDLEADLRSDTRSVFPMVEALAAAAGPSLRWMRDPTRGGVATSLNELALDSGLGIHISEEAIPVRDEVRGACELLGLDPLHIANEGQFLAVLGAEAADRALEAIHAVPGGDSVVIIGEVREEPRAAVLAGSRYGGTRIVDMLVGDPLPRIC